MRTHQRGVHRLKDEAGEGDILRALLVLVGGHEVVPGVLECDLRLAHFGIAPDAELEFVAGELPLHGLGHFHLLAVYINGAVALDGVAINGEEHVTRMDHAAAGAVFIHMRNEHADLVVGQLERGALRGVEDLKVSDAEVHVAVVFTVLHVLEKAMHDGRGDHIAGILRHVAAVALEGDADDFVVLEHGAAAVPGIDGGVYLDGKMLVHSAVRIALVVHAADDAARHADALAADGKADDFYCGVELGDFRADGERLHFLKGLRGLNEFEQREIAVVRDVLHFRAIGRGVADLADVEPRGVAHDVGIGQKEIRGDKKPGAAAAAGRSGVPRRLIVHLHAVALDVDDSLVLRAERSGGGVVGFFLAEERRRRSESEEGGKGGKRGAGNAVHSAKCRTRRATGTRFPPAGKEEVRSRR